MRMKKAMLDYQEFIVPVATIVKKESEKTIDDEAKKEIRGKNFVEAAYNTDVGWASSSDRPPTDL